MSHPKYNILINDSYPDTTNGTAIYTDQLTSSQPPELIGKYTSPLGPWVVSGIGLPLPRPANSGANGRLGRAARAVRSAS